MSEPRDASPARNTENQPEPAEVESDPPAPSPSFVTPPLAPRQEDIRETPEVALVLQRIAAESNTPISDPRERFHVVRPPILNLDDDVPIPQPPPGYEEIHREIQQEREDRQSVNEMMAECLKLLTTEKTKTYDNPVKGILRKIPDGLPTLANDCNYISFVKWCEQSVIFFDKIGKEGKTYFGEVLSLIESTMKIRASTSQMDLHGIWPSEHVLSTGEVHDSLEAYTRHALTKSVPARIMNIALDNKKTRVIDILYIARYTVAYENNFAQLRIMRDR